MRLPPHLHFLECLYAAEREEQLFFLLFCNAIANDHEWNAATCVFRCCDYYTMHTIYLKIIILASNIIHCRFLSSKLTTAHTRCSMKL